MPFHRPWIVPFFCCCSSIFSRMMKSIEQCSHVHASIQSTLIVLANFARERKNGKNSSLDDSIGLKYINEFCKVQRKRQKIFADQNNRWRWIYIHDNPGKYIEREENRANKRIQWLVFIGLQVHNSTILFRFISFSKLYFLVSLSLAFFYVVVIFLVWLNNREKKQKIY